jgi:hypothetical protein
MEKIDRLGWAAGISFTAYGRRVGVRVNRPEVMERILRHLPFGWKPSGRQVVERLYSVVAAVNPAGSSIRRFHLLYNGAARVARTADEAGLYEALASDLRMFIAEGARRRVFVHAGVVGWMGAAIVIPGRSYSGKSTLVRELVRAGAAYYSDEYAVFDSRGRVHPYAKPISIRQEGNAGRQTDCAVEMLGGRAGRSPLPVRMILVTSFKPGVRWRPRPLSAGQGALALLANTVAVRRQPERTLATLREAVAKASVLKGTRGEARDIVEPVLDSVGPGNGLMEMAG